MFMLEIVNRFKREVIGTEVFQTEGEMIQYIEKHKITDFLIWKRDLVLGEIIAKSEYK